MKKYHHSNRELPKIEESKIIASGVIGYTPGEWSGPLINLLRYSSTPKYPDERNLNNLTAEALRELDHKHPGAIYLIDPFQFLDHLDREQKEKLFYMLTPNKKGNIIYNTDGTWSHLDTIYNHDKVFTCQISDPSNESLILTVPDYEIISVISNGRNAIIYRK